MAVKGLAAAVNQAQNLDEQGSGDGVPGAIEPDEVEAVLANIDADRRHLICRFAGCVSEHGRSIPLTVIERNELCLRCTENKRLPNHPA